MKHLIIAFFACLFIYCPAEAWQTLSTQQQGYVINGSVDPRYHNEGDSTLTYDTWIQFSANEWTSVYVVNYDAADSIFVSFDDIDDDTPIIHRAVRPGREYSFINFNARSFLMKGRSTISFDFFK